MKESQFVRLRQSDWEAWDRWLGEAGTRRLAQRGREGRSCPVICRRRIAGFAMICRWRVPLPAWTLAGIPDRRTAAPGAPGKALRAGFRAALFRPAVDHALAVAGLAQL
jgi:hypothetical protein